MRQGWDAYLPYRDQFTALAPEKYQPEYVDARVLVGTWRCWADDTAAILAEMRSYPTGLREVHGLAAVGPVEAILPLIELAEEWGRRNGCEIASIESRPAWAKLLPGYAVEQVRIVKGLS